MVCGAKGITSDPPNMYEEVVKVPLLISWPGKIPTGEVAPELISFYDVIPTLCEAAGVAPPSGRNLGDAAFYLWPSVIRCRKTSLGAMWSLGIFAIRRWPVTLAINSCSAMTAKVRMSFRVARDPREKKSIRRPAIHYGAGPSGG